MKQIAFALTLLLSSSLLFVVQPMVAKMIQPILGGTPAVWNTAMVFFQALLLGGYLYAHLTTRWLSTRRQAVMHLVVLAVGLLFLPIGFSPPADPASLEAPMLWLLGAMLVAVGWPFFVVSTSAPLLQRWFSTIDHPDAADPYYLYAASNLGSVIALLGYPLVIEPHIGLELQSWVWMVAYGVFCISIAICAGILWTSPPPDETETKESSPPAGQKPVTWRRRGQWIVWAFIPSSLMLAVTTIVTTDVAPMPLLWIPPLAIFLLSFIIVFARRQLVAFRFWLTLFPVAMVGLATLYLVDFPGPLWLVTVLTFAGLFIFCMAFHGLLAADRPATTHLTEFYLWMSFGGVCGGIFNALLAPVVFDRLLEFPTTLLVAALVFPLSAYRRPATRIALLGALAVCGSIAVYTLTTRIDLHVGWPALAVAIWVAGFVIPMIAVRLFMRWLPGVLAALVLIPIVVDASSGPGELHVERSFFGVHAVVEDAEADKHLIHHGATLHGVQFRDDEVRDEPASYHYREGPIGEVFAMMKQRPDRHPVAVAGLGAGSLAAYALPEQSMDFYEIDPVVKEIAKNPDYFSYLDQCRGDCEVILGDARLQLDTAASDYYGLIVLDAYSSTAVPVHLLTREAVEMYADKLRPDGLMAFHISNDHVDLEPALTRIAADLGLSSRTRMHHSEPPEDGEAPLGRPSRWVVMANHRHALGEIADGEAWENPPPRSDVRVWTDDYADVLRFYKW